MAFERIYVVRLNLLGDREFLKKLSGLTWPLVFQSLMLALVAAADAFMLGRVEQNAMAAVSLATQIQFVQNMVLFSAASAASILGAQYWGKKDEEALNHIFGLMMKVCGITSVLFFIGCFFFPRYLMLLFTNEEELILIGIGYLKVAGWSYLLTGVSQTYLALMKVTDHAADAAKISSTAVVLNIILNAVLIYGLFGMPELGVQGAALATLIARVIELGLCLILAYKPGYVAIGLQGILKTEKLLAKDFTKCFIPLVAASLLWGIGFTSYSAFMGHMGKDAAAANSIAAVIRDLICCMCNGLSAAGGIVVGNELGKGDLKTGKLYGDRIMVLSYILGVFSCILMALVIPLALRFVKLSAEARYDLIGMMLIMSFYMIGRVVNTVIINGIFAAGGDTVFDTYSLAVTMWGIAVPLAALGTFVFHWPVFVVYACTCLDEVGKIPWVMIHYKKYKWVKDLTREYQE